jgi:TRAP-type transport system periplasmic protein
MSLPPAMRFKIGGYQGAKSVLTGGLLHLKAGLVSASFPWAAEAELDVTQVGETAATLFASVELGERHICYMASGYLVAKVPELGVLDLPFSIQNRSAALAALDHEAGDWIKRAVESKTDYRVLGFWDNGFRHLSNSQRPIKTAADCQGLCIRTLNNQNYKMTLEALGFSVRITDVKDLVHVIETGQVQAQENPLTNLLNFDIWKHHSFVSLTGHYFGIALLLCNRNWFESLDLSAQQTLQQTVDTVTEAQRCAATLEDAKALEFLVENNVEITSQKDLDLASMKSLAESVNTGLKSSVSPDLLKLYLADQY